MEKEKLKDKKYICDLGMKEVEKWGHKWYEGLYKKYCPQFKDEEAQRQFVKDVVEIYCKTEFIFDDIFMLEKEYRNLTEEEIKAKKDDKKLEKYKKQVIEYKKGKDINKELIQLAKEEYIEYEAKNKGKEKGN